MKRRSLVMIVYIFFCTVGLAAGEQSFPVYNEPAGDESVSLSQPDSTSSNESTDDEITNLPHPDSVSSNPLGLLMDILDGKHLALITVVILLVFFMVLIFYICPTIARIKNQEKVLEELISKINNIEESVCSMGGLSKRLVEIERRTLEIPRMLSKMYSKLRNHSNVEENIRKTRERA